jgi:hypothetical protein
VKVETLTADKKAMTFGRRGFAIGVMVCRRRR